MGERAGIFKKVGGLIKKADPLLFCLCLASSVFGIILISSAASSLGAKRYVIVQTAALIVGVIAYFIVSIPDIDELTERWPLLLAFNVLFIASLYLFGVDGGTGNRSWLSFSWLPVGIQPSEFVKITFTLLLARQMFSRRGAINAPSSVVFFALHLMLMLLLILTSSRDAGSALVYCFIFVFMAIAAGISVPWFLAGLAILCAALPLLWKSGFISDYQKLRLLIIIDPSLDPDSLGVAWQAAQSKTALAAGKLLGQGLYKGAQTQSGAIPAIHTDFIFSAAGEELGLVGCALIVILLFAIISRCIYKAVKSTTPLTALVCAGFAGMLIFQTFENIGMCTGLTPVIGITLPFFSYGGSSLLASFICMGLVGGVKLRK